MRRFAYVVIFAVIHGHAVVSRAAPLRLPWHRGRTTMKVTGTTVLPLRKGEHRLRVGQGRPWQLRTHRWGKPATAEPTATSTTTADVEVQDGRPTLSGARLGATFAGCTIQNPAEIGRGLLLGKSESRGGTGLSDLVDSGVSYTPSTATVSYTRGLGAVTVGWTGKTNLGARGTLGVPTLGGAIGFEKLVLPLARGVARRTFPQRGQLLRQGLGIVSQVAPEVRGLVGSRLGFTLDKLDNAAHIAVVKLKPGTHGLLRHSPGSRFKGAFKFRVPDKPTPRSADPTARVSLQMSGAVATGEARSARDRSSLKLLDLADVSLSSMKIGVTFDPPVLVAKPLTMFHAFKSALRGDSVTGWRHRIAKRMGWALPAGWDCLYTLSVKRLALEARAVSAPSGRDRGWSGLWRRLRRGFRGTGRPQGRAEGASNVGLKLTLEASSKLLDRWTFPFNRTRTVTLRAPDFAPRTGDTVLIRGLEGDKPLLSLPPGRQIPLAGLLFKALAEPRWSLDKPVVQAEMLSSAEGAAKLTVRREDTGDRWSIEARPRVSFEPYRQGFSASAGLESRGIQGDYTVEGSHSCPRPP